MQAMFRPIRPAVEPPLSRQELAALQQACGPVELLGFPSVEVMHALRRHGYVTIVLGGLQITDRGLERLIRERSRARALA